MLLLKYLFLAAGYGLFAAAAAVLLYDAYRWWKRYQAPEAQSTPGTTRYTDARAALKRRCTCRTCNTL